MPVVSIIIPVYNVEKYLTDCLTSLKNQGYESLEIIAINDGSTDDSLLILEEYKEKFSNFKIVNQKNKGQSTARNKGLDLCSGKYTYFLDADDYLLKNTIRNLVNLAEKNNLDLVRFNAGAFVEKGFEYNTFNENQYDAKTSLSENVVYDNKSFLEQVTKEKKGFYPSVCLYFIKTELLKKSNLNFLEGVIHEDELFCALLMQNPNRIMYDSNQYFQRRFRPGSTMTTSRENEKSFSSRIMVIEGLASKIQTGELSDSYRKFLNSRKIEVILSLNGYRLNDKKKMKQLRKNVKVFPSEKIEIQARKIVRKTKSFIKKSVAFKRGNR